MKEGDLIAGRYRLERRVGTGGMGTVFRAFDEEDRRRVAIKTLSDQPMGDSLQTSGSRLAARFEREASALAAISVAGVVRYVAHGISESHEPYLVMQWVEGQDLASRLNDRGLTSNETLRLGVRLAEALAALHAHGIVHRDVKPANVMLEHGEVERAVLVDLGVARRAGLASATLTGARVGTPSYMAPEQIRDGRAVDGRADVFSLGCILFECLSGRRAFDAEDGLGAIAKILLEGAPSLKRLRPDLPGSLSDFVAMGEDFGLLAPVRDFALTELARAGLDAELARRHGEYQARRVRELCGLREVEGARKTLLRLEHDVDDVLAAVEYALAAPQLESDFVLVALVALEPLITARGPLPAFMRVLDRAIAAADASATVQSSELLARVLSLRGRLSTTSGAFARARADLLRARDIAEAQGAAELYGGIWLEIGVNHHFQRELAAARDCYERALELCRGRQQDSVRGRCYGNLGAVLHDQGRLTEAAAHYWKAIRTLEESGEARELGNFLSNLAVLEQELGARADARRHYQEALSYLRDLAEARLHAIALGNLGVLESEEGAWDAARQCHRRALELLRTQQDPFSEALCRARLGGALAMLQREDEADEELSRARRSIAAADPARIAAVRLQRVFLDLARARRALDAGDHSESEQRLVLAEEACAEIATEQHKGVKLKTLSDDVRATLRVLAPLLRTTRERIAARTDPPAATLAGD